MLGTWEKDSRHFLSHPTTGLTGTPAADEILTPSPRRAPARAAAHKSPLGLSGVGVAVWGRPALLSHLLRPGPRLPPDSGSVLPFSVCPRPA